MRHLRTALLLFVCVNMLAGLSFAAIDVGQPAPDFTLQTVDDETISLSDYKGQVVILHFWKSN